MAGDDGTLPDDRRFEENIWFEIRILTHNDSADRRFDVNSCCGVGKGHSGCSVDAS